MFFRATSHSGTNFYIDYFCCCDKKKNKTCPRHLGKRNVCLGLHFLRQNSLWQGGYGSRGPKQEAGRFDFGCTEEASRETNCKWGKAINCKGLLQRCLSSSIALHPNRSVISQNRTTKYVNQVFKYANPWEIFVIQTATHIYKIQQNSINNLKCNQSSLLN